MSIGIQKAIDSSAVKNTCYLYVEGRENSIDPRVMNELFSLDGLPSISIRSMGSANFLQGFSEAIQRHEKNHFFIVDRDHHRMREELNWDHFESGKANFLVWKKKELENYFIDPDFLKNSEFFKGNEDQLREAIRTTCQKRLYLDVANYVVVTIREQMKETWIGKFENSRIDSFSDYQSSLDLLQTISDWKKFQDKVSALTCHVGIEKLFNDYYREMMGDDDKNATLEFGKGKWLEMTSGKDVLNNLVNQSGLFNNHTTNDVAVRLVKKSSEDQLPHDFIDLKNTVIKRATAVIEGKN